MLYTKEEWATRKSQYSFVQRAVHEFEAIPYNSGRLAKVLIAFPTFGFSIKLLHENPVQTNWEALSALVNTFGRLPSAALFFLVAVGPVSTMMTNSVPYRTCWHAFALVFWLLLFGVGFFVGSDIFDPGCWIALMSILALGTAEALVAQDVMKHKQYGKF